MSHLQPTVFVVDDDQSARDSVKTLVRSMGVEAETFASAEEFLERFDRQKPGCLVTDLRMLGMNGIELQDRLIAEGVNLPVIMITAHAETPLTVRAVKTGAVTVLEKPCQDLQLFNAIQSALSIDHENRSQDAELTDVRKRLQTLSAEEQTVLEMMLEGIANKVMARRLDVSVRTVENRRQRVFEKTGASSLPELVRWIVQIRGGS